MEVSCTFVSSKSYPSNMFNSRNIQHHYTCKVENQLIHEDTELIFVGQHLDTKTNNDVNMIFFNLCFITKVPAGLLKSFPNLQSLQICGSNLKVLSKTDLIEYKNFKEFDFNSNQIEFLPGDLFEGFENIEKISFNNNNLKVIEPNIFDGLRKLSSIELRCNPSYNFYSLPNIRYSSKPDILKLLSDSYFARLKFLMDMKNSAENLKQENQILKNSEKEMVCEITNLKRSLEIEKLKKSNLKFPHPSCFCSELIKILKDENIFKDFKILVDNQEFHVNKLLLAARSPVLAEILRDNPDTESINLIDISVQTFKEILTYLYTDKLPCEKITNCQDLFAAAHRLKIYKLKDIAALEITDKITVDNAADILALSNKCEHDKLRQNAFNEIKTNYPKIEFKDEWAVQPEKVAEIIEAYKAKEEKIRRMETMVQNIEQQFQNLLT